MHISRIVLGILIARKKTFLHQSSRFGKNMTWDFFKDLEPWRRKHKAKRDWRGAKGGERDKFRSPD
jgi:hypothetical protein